MRKALRFSCSIVCCHVPGFSFCWAFSDLQMSDAIGGIASCNASLLRLFIGAAGRHAWLRHLVLWLTPVEDSPPTSFQSPVSTCCL